MAVVNTNVILKCKLIDEKNKLGTANDSHVWVFLNETWVEINLKLLLFESCSILNRTNTKEDRILEK